MKKILLIILLVVSVDFTFVYSQSKSVVDENSSLYYTCRIWGFLKYHHPVVMSGKYDWDNELFKILDKTNGVTSKRELNNIYQDWISELGNFTCGVLQTIKDSSEYKQFADYRWLNDDFFNNDLLKQLNDIKTAKRDDANYYIGWEYYPCNLRFGNEKEYEIDYVDNRYMLLALFRYWNIIEYCFPYKYLTNNDWDDVLKKYIPIFNDADNKIKYFSAVALLVAELNDSHAYSYCDKFNIVRVIFEYYGWTGRRNISIQTSYVEDRLVVTGYYKDAPNYGLLIGDVILSMNGEKVEDRRDRIMSYFSISNEEGFCNNGSYRLLEFSDSVVVLTCQRGDSIINLNVDSSTKYYLENIKRDVYRFVSDSIGYIYTGKITKNAVDSVMELAKDTHGLIIDLRCYPKEPVVSDLGNYLCANVSEFDKSTYFSAVNPGQFKLNNEPGIGNGNLNLYKGKIVILVNSMTMSNAEFSAMAWRRANNAIIIGSQTVGADGNLAQLKLPGNITTSFSGAGVYYPDGGETQRVGVRIDEIVKPTIKGIREGRDEILERAVEIINSK